MNHLASRHASSLRLDVPFIFIGSGSSGTHLLGIMLDRHPDIACGPELGVFNKKLIYSNFEQVSQDLTSHLKHGLSTGTYSDYRAFFRNPEAYFWNPDELSKLVDTSCGPKEFFDQFFARYLHRRGKKIWGEKTLSNVYCVDEFLRMYPKAKLIHLYRDGRDVVCSKKRRGAPLQRACRQWFVDVSTALYYRGYPQYLELKYEDLVAAPETSLRRICDHLDVTFAPSMLSDATDDYWENLSREFHESWKSVPSASNISSRSIGQWKQQLGPPELQKFWSVRRNFLACLISQVVHRDTDELMNDLGYDSGRPEGPPWVQFQANVEAAWDWVYTSLVDLRRGELPRLPLTYFGHT